MKKSPARPPSTVVPGFFGPGCPLKIKVGIIICDRYRTCAGGKCFRSLQNREGAFAIYKGKEVEIAAFATCGGCPGGNIDTHHKLNTWRTPFLRQSIKLTVADEKTRIGYDH